jgi:DNA modification methylase
LILAGHARYLAAKLLGFMTVPTLCVGGLNEAQKRAFLLADNKFAERAAWDRDMLAAELQELSVVLPSLELDIAITGFEAGEIEILLGEVENEKPEPEDWIPPTTGLVTTRRGDKWQLGRHRILCGDARDASDYARLAQNERAAMVFADPPYNVPVRGHVQGRGRHKHAEFAFASGEMTEAEYASFLAHCLGCAAHASRDGAVHYVCMDWRHIEILMRVGREIYGSVLNIVVWNKVNPGQGSFYRSQHELIGVFRVGDASHQNNIELGRHGRNRSNVWTYPGFTGFGPGRDEAFSTHPTIKPVALVADAIRDCTSKGDLVLDPFLGAGTAVLAAEKVGRVCCGLEYEPAYIDAGVRRWQAYTGRDAVLDGDGRTFDEIAAEREGAKAEAARAAGPDKRDIDSPGDIGSTGEDWVRLCGGSDGAKQ